MSSVILGVLIVPKYYILLSHWSVIMLGVISALGLLMQLLPEPHSHIFNLYIYRLTETARLLRNVFSRSMNRVPNADQQPRKSPFVYSHKTLYSMLFLSLCHVNVFEVFALFYCFAVFRLL